MFFLFCILLFFWPVNIICIFKFIFEFLFSFCLLFIDFLGRTEVRVKEVLEEAQIRKGPITKRLILHEVDTGEVIVKLDLQLYDSWWKTFSLPVTDTLEVIMMKDLFRFSLPVTDTQEVNVMRDLFIFSLPFLFINGQVFCLWYKLFSLQDLFHLTSLQLSGNPEEILLEVFMNNGSLGNSDPWQN